MINKQLNYTNLFLTSVRKQLVRMEDNLVNITDKVNDGFKDIHQTITNLKGKVVQGIPKPLIQSNLKPHLDIKGFKITNKNNELLDQIVNKLKGLNIQVIQTSTSSSENSDNSTEEEQQPKK